MPPRKGRNTRTVRKKPPSSHASSSGDSSTLSPVKSAHSPTPPEEPEEPRLNPDIGDIDPEALLQALGADNPETDFGDALLQADLAEDDFDSGPVEGQPGSIGEGDDLFFLPPVYFYPVAGAEYNLLPEPERLFKIARFVPCREEGCECEGLEPPEGAMVVEKAPEVKEERRRGRRKTEERQAAGDVDTGGKRIPADEDRTEEGWWRRCGKCGHGWEADGEGHTFEVGLSKIERTRRGKVVVRMEEQLQDQSLLTTWPTPRIEENEGLYKQLFDYVRPGGKKPVTALPPAFDLSQPGTPSTPALASTPGGSEDDRPRKRKRRLATGEVEDPEVNEANGQNLTSPSHKGKKPGGKTSGKGTKPRTVVRGARGLIPMETDAAGDLHVAGQIPESATAPAENGAPEEEEEEDLPLAQRPTLDEGERRRREVIKEKEREREDEVVRRLTKGVNVEDGGEGLGRAEPGVDVDVWEGVELPKLPPRPAAVEESRSEIMLTVVASRNPNPVSTILLIGLKNLFQKQLPKMPREYITRLVLDKNHISMAIVKRGWRVVGGVCYRPFESRGFAEIVFFAVDSSEQIKGYGSHLMNSLKDHVRRAHPTINHFLTYADNYAVGYFKKQGFTKEISFSRERWVGYIKDYEGGTIMQCMMLPKVRYLDVHQMLADQKAAIMAKIRTISKSHVVHPGLKVFKHLKAGEEIKVRKEDVPGLAESGWNPDLDEIIRQPKRNPHHVLLQLVLNDLQNEPSAWPFVKPVDSNVVHDYYEVIKEPMDLSTMEYKLENNHYDTVEAFWHDAQLMFGNCRQYNGEKNVYTQQANKLEKALERIMKKRQSAL